jgi:DNA-binding NarL/FixJ family response regulator
MKAKTCRVLLIGREPHLTSLVHYHLGKTNEYQILLPEKIKASQKPDVGIMCCELRHDALPMFQATRQQYPDLPLLLFCNQLHQPELKTMVKDGIAGVLIDRNCEQLTLAIHTILKNACFVTHDTLQKLLAPTVSNRKGLKEFTANLSHSAISILKYMYQNLHCTQESIATNLFKSIGCVETNLRVLRNHFGVNKTNDIKILMKEYDLSGWDC